MALRPSTWTFDTADPVRVAAFWAAALAFDLDPESDQEGAYVSDPSKQTHGLYFQPVPEPKVMKNRVHLDLRSAGTMAEEVARLRELGASELRFVDEGPGWTVMADPEGDEFCVLRGVSEGARRSRLGIDSVVVDCGDPFAAAAFWIGALDYREHERGTSGIEIDGPQDGDLMLSFVTVPEPKTVKNRIHLDVRPTGSMADEVQRMKDLGASERGSIEVEDSFWTQMRDPEGNEFCVLRGPDDGWSPGEVLS
ncbi:MAG: VOC family protein [Actinomycetota bacterium]|nr:VOC family protein [Actinomycetota bacterium]